MRESRAGRQAEIQQVLLAKTSWADFKQSHVYYFTVISSYGQITQVFSHDLPAQATVFSADTAALEGLTFWHSGNFLIASAAV